MLKLQSVQEFTLQTIPPSEVSLEAMRSHGELDLVELTEMVEREPDSTSSD